MIMVFEHGLFGIGLKPKMRIVDHDVPFLKWRAIGDVHMTVMWCFYKLQSS